MKPNDVEAHLDDLDAAVDTAMEDIEHQLIKLETAIDRLPSPQRPPKTTLQIQGAAGSEGAWQRYLAYFLDPEDPHGLGTAALNRFLQGIGGKTGGALPEYASEDVVVETERESDEANRPDIIIRDEGRFFICCELKLYSGEGTRQTERYVADEQVGQTPKSAFPEAGHHYVYVRRPGRPDAAADEFVTVTWGEVREWLTPLLVEEYGGNLTRTTAQLSDFLDTIRHDMTEDEHLQTEREKMALYFEHRDAIREARQGLENVYEYEVGNWARRFKQGYLPESWSPEWHCNSNRYGQFYHSRWRQDDGLYIDDASVKMHFVHLIRDFESFEDGQLTVQLRWPGETPYRERFKELFVSERFDDQVNGKLGEYDIEKLADYSYNNPRFTEKTYSVVRTELPDSYYERLSLAVEEHIQIAPVINGILETAIKEVEAER